MAKVLTDDTHYTNIANATRTLLGNEEAMKPAQITENLDDIVQEIIGQTDLIEQIKTILSDKVANSVNISVSSDGLISVAINGEDSATKQLTRQEAKTVTPSTSEQTVVLANRYTIGDIKVAGDTDLVASNIKSGVSIFGVAGTFAPAYDRSVT